MTTKRFSRITSWSHDKAVAVCDTLSCVNATQWRGHAPGTALLKYVSWQKRSLFGVPCLLAVQLVVVTLRSWLPLTPDETTLASLKLYREVEFNDIAFGTELPSYGDGASLPRQWG